MDPRSFGLFTGTLPTAFRRGDPAAGMKSREERHVRSLQRLFEALEDGDIASFLEGMHADVEFELVAPAVFQYRLRAHGVNELRSLVEHNFALVTDQKPETLNLVAQGNSLVLLVRERGLLRASGQSYDAHLAIEFTFRDGKISRIREIFATSDS